MIWKILFNLFAGWLHKRFVAGDTIQDAVAKAKFYKERGEKSVINILGNEHAKDHRKATLACDQIIELMILLNKEGLTDVHVAEKPSCIGLDTSETLYLYNKTRILRAAQIYLPNGLVETDAEDHVYRETVFRITVSFSRTLQNQMLTVQLNHRNTFGDIAILNARKIPYRLCKGNAYPGYIKKEKELRNIFLELAPLAIKQGNKPAFATHDLYLIDSIAKKFLQDKDKFEFDLLMGIEEGLCKEPHLQGFTFRRYIPCGPNWRPYGERRGKAILKIWLRNFLYRVRGG